MKVLKVNVVLEFVLESEDDLDVKEYLADLNEYLGELPGSPQVVDLDDVFDIEVKNLEDDDLDDDGLFDEDYEEDPFDNEDEEDEF